MVYWIIRTPQEVLKTKVQAGTEPNVMVALNKIKERDGIKSLWNFYPVMISLDVPFQVINFILYGILSDAVFNSGIETSILTRLGVGIGCGMVAAAATCPIDVCKTRIQTSIKSAAANSAENSNNDNIELISSSNVGRSRKKSLLSWDTSESESDGSLKELPKQLSYYNEDEIMNNNNNNKVTKINQNVLVEMAKIVKEEGVSTLFLGLGQRVIYTGLANGLRFAAYGTSRMDLMMRNLDDL